jgi:hypothetical protein
MLAVIDHVDLPKPSAPAVHATPRCGSKFDSIDRGMIVAAALMADVDPDWLENLAMDVSDAFQKRLVPRVTRHIRGDAAAFVKDGFSKVTPKAWSLCTSQLFRTGLPLDRARLA